MKKDSKRVMVGRCFIEYDLVSQVRKFTSDRSTEIQKRAPTNQFESMIWSFLKKHKGKPNR
jgi:hypothetical protein